MAKVLAEAEVTVIMLSDAAAVLGILLPQGPGLIARWQPLVLGIAHQVTLRLQGTQLFEPIATRNSVERELAMASSIQEGFLPGRPLERVNGLISADSQIDIRVNVYGMLCGSLRRGIAPIPTVISICPCSFWHTRDPGRWRSNGWCLARGEGVRYDTHILSFSPRPLLIIPGMKTCQAGHVASPIGHRIGEFFLATDLPHKRTRAVLHRPG